MGKTYCKNCEQEIFEAEETRKQKVVKIQRNQLIYASRTHTQIEQVMKELRKTAYKNCKAIVLGSRDLLCSNDELKIE